MNVVWKSIWRRDTKASAPTKCAFLTSSLSVQFSSSRLPTTRIDILLVDSIKLRSVCTACFHRIQLSLVFGLRHKQCLGEQAMIWTNAPQGSLLHQAHVNVKPPIRWAVMITGILPSLLNQVIEHR